MEGNHGDLGGEKPMFTGRRFKVRKGVWTLRTWLGWGEWRKGEAIVREAEDGDEREESVDGRQLGGRQLREEEEKLEM